MSAVTTAVDATRIFAEHAAATQLERLDAATVEHAKQAILDCIGIAVRAAEADSTPALLRAVEALDAGGPARAIGLQRRYQAQYAALINATLAHTLDFDDTHIGGSLHPGAVVIPATLAIAETEHRSGAAVLMAVVAGYDVAVRLSEALTPAAQYARGFHPTATCGTFAAAAAVGKLAGADAAAIANAFGIALCSAAGSMQYLENGSWNKRFHVGFAAHDGIVAERFARAGVVGAERAFEGRFGFAHGYAGATTFAGLSAALAGERAIDETAFKPYPSCRYTHAALDELIDLQREHRFAPDDIEHVTIGLPEVSFALVKDPEPAKRSPRSIVDGQFSMFFLAAVALLRGGFGWSDYALLDDPDVHRLALRVEVVSDPEIEALGQSMAARVVVRAGGRTFERFTRAPKGEPDRPLTWAEVIEKFRGLTGQAFPKERQERVIALVHGLDRLADTADLMELLGA
jgi:2-methylcitrate dehydratase PrpD